MPTGKNRKLKTMKHLLFTLLLLCLAMPLRLTAADGDELWQLHLAYADATDHVEAGREIYAVFSGNLIVYDRDDQSVRQLDRLGGLSDKGIKAIGYSATEKLVVILYENNNIDLIDVRTGRIQNVPQIKNNTETQLTVNGMSVNGGWGTLATDKGVVLLNLARREVRGFYNLGENVACAAVNDAATEVYASTSTDILAAELTANLNVITSWKSIRHTPAKAIYPFAGGLYAFVSGGEGLQDPTARFGYLAPPDDQGNRRFTRLIEGSTLFPCTVGEDEFVLLTATGILRYKKDTPLKPVPASYHKIRYSKISNITSADSLTLWISESDNGLRAYRIDADSVRLTGEAASGFGPSSDQCYKLRYDRSPEGKTELIVTGGGYDPFDKTYNDGLIMTATGDEWFTYPGSGNVFPGLRYRNVMTVLRRPSHPQTLYATLGGGGLLQYEDGKAFKQYYNANSPLASAAPDGSRHYVRCSAMVFDADENLWVLNSSVETPIHVLRPDSTWVSLEAPGIESQAHLEEALFDRDGRLWVASSFDNGIVPGLFCLDYNGTLTEPDDDECLFRISATNDDGTSVSLNATKALAIDLTGQLWVGCTSGIYVIPNPAEWFSTDFTIRQPKVPRNDGTNYADYLLQGANVTDIAVDAANRKWIATAASGIYLVNADGTEVLTHFTAENSPLLSDVVYSLAIDHATGRLMIATAAGLCSYAGTATTPEATLNESSVKVSPNPVRPEHHGRVMISGLTDNAEVKIVSAASQLVARGTSTGGTFAWDAKGPSGRRVAPGVYYLLIATADGNESVAAKIVVI